MADSLTFLSQICGALKKIKRTGWVRSNVPLPESDADHMHRCAMCAMLVTNHQHSHSPSHPKGEEDSNSNLLHPNNVNSTKLLKMALTHDLCESIAGDITPFCSRAAITNKHQNEEDAMKRISAIVGDPLGSELYQLWKEYEEQVTAEALYCKDIDKFEMVLQAYEYEEEHLSFNINNSKSHNYVDDNNDRKKKKIKMDSSSDGQQQQQRQTGKTNVESDVNGKNGATITKDAVNSTSNNSNTGIAPLRSFFITTNNKIKTPLFRSLDAELRQKREALLKERGWEVTDEERQQYNNAED